MNYSITPIDGGLVTLIIMAVQAIKPKVPDRFVPVLPFLFGWILVTPAIIISDSGIPTVSVFISKIFLEGLKVGALASATFKVGHTSILGKGVDKDEGKVEPVDSNVNKQNLS